MDLYISSVAYDLQVAMGLVQCRRQFRKIIRTMFTAFLKLSSTASRFFAHQFMGFMYVLLSFLDFARLKALMPRLTWVYSHLLTPLCRIQVVLFFIVQRFV